MEKNAGGIIEVLEFISIPMTKIGLIPIFLENSMVLELDYKKPKVLSK